MVPLIFRKTTKEQIFWKWFIDNVRIGDYSPGADDIWFTHEPDGDRVGLTLYIQNLTDENERVPTQAAFILLDGALGEFDVEERVGFIEREPLPSNPEDHGLLPFASIRQVFDDVLH